MVSYLFVYCFQRIANEEVKAKEYYKEIAIEQRSILQDLFKHRNRPDLSKDSTHEVYVIAKDLVEKWRAFVKYGTRLKSSRILQYVLSFFL